MRDEEPPWVVEGVQGGGQNWIQHSAGMPAAATEASRRHRSLPPLPLRQFARGGGGGGGGDRCDIYLTATAPGTGSRCKGRISTVASGDLVVAGSRGVGGRKGGVMATLGSEYCCQAVLRHGMRQPRRVAAGCSRCGTWQGGGSPGGWGRWNGSARTTGAGLGNRFETDGLTASTGYRWVHLLTNDHAPGLRLQRRDHEIWELTHGCTLLGSLSSSSRASPARTGTGGHHERWMIDLGETLGPR